MRKGTAAVMKKGGRGSDPRVQLTLNQSWTVTPTNVTAVTGWTAVSFSTEVSGLMTGTMTITSGTINFTGYLTKKNKLKFAFTGSDGNLYVAKGTLNNSANPATITSGSLKKWKAKSSSQANIHLHGRRDTDDGTWTATAQSGGGKPSY